jgi:hypothetical protein
MSRPRIAALVLALVVALPVALVGCSTPAPAPGRSSAPAAEKSGSGEVRHDLEPLTSRFPQLANAQSATWLSGSLGDDRVPGPSLKWIDAVVTLPASDIAAMRSLYALAPADAAPRVVEALEPELPASLLAADDLDAAFSTDGFQSRVYLGEATDTLVLVTVFE